MSKAGSVLNWELPKLEGMGVGPVLSKPQHDLDWDQVKLKLESWKKEAQEQGFKEGERKGLEAGQARWASASKAFEICIEQFKQALGGLNGGLGQELESLVFKMLRLILVEELKINSQHIRHLVQEGLKMLSEESLQITLHIHPSDEKKLDLSPLVKEQIKLVIDDNVTEGGCVFESAFNKIDASLEARWESLVRELKHD